MHAAGPVLLGLVSSHVNSALHGSIIDIVDFHAGRSLEVGNTVRARNNLCELARNKLDCLAGCIILRRWSILCVGYNCCQVVCWMEEIYEIGGLKQLWAGKDMPRLL